MTIPTLTDDRIDAMRQHVMHRVDHDIQRRGKRARVTIGLAAASVVVVGLGGYALNLADDGGSPVASSIAEPSSGGTADRSESGSLTQAPDAGRQVITTGDVSVTVKQPHATAQRLSTWVESIGGRVDNRSETGSGEDASASVTVRVPSDQVTATIDRLESYGKVDDLSVQNNDVTTAAKDLDARMQALELSISRLEKIMAESGSSAELIKAEGALTQRQEQLESLQAQRKGLADQVSLSTLTVSLTRNAQVDSVEPGGFAGGLRDGWNGLVSTVNAVVELAGRVLPWAALALIALGVVRLLRRAGAAMRHHGA